MLHEPWQPHFDLIWFLLLTNKKEEEGEPSILFLDCSFSLVSLWRYKRGSINKQSNLCGINDAFLRFWILMQKQGRVGKITNTASNYCINFFFKKIEVNVYIGNIVTRNTLNDYVKVGKFFVIYFFIMWPFIWLYSMTTLTVLKGAVLFDCLLL